LDRKDSRRYPRTDVNFPVEFTVGDRAFREQASNLGGGGLFLAITEPLSVGAELTVRFRPAKHLRLIETKGRVCYQVPGKGIGVEFIDISAKNRQVLLRFILGRSGDKRRHPRAPLLMQVECQECTSLAFSRDVSVGGVFLETKQSMVVGSELNLRFHLDKEGPIVHVRAEVKYEVVKLGMGVQFVDLAPEDLKRIEAYVSKLQSAPRRTSPKIKIQ
jgi:c-di-GMP-binding flagellar brake protein YcgR